MYRPIKKIAAKAEIIGNKFAPHLRGTITFSNSAQGVKVSAVIRNLPPNKTGFYGFHLHEAGICKGEFQSAGGHYNPENELHPKHAGDFPMLISAKGHNAYLVFVTSRFTIREIINRSVIIHMEADDYTSQPGGNAGRRIGCGMVEKVK